jgi:hypothetical protein
MRRIGHLAVVLVIGLLEGGRGIKPSSSTPPVPALLKSNLIIHTVVQYFAISKSKLPIIILNQNNWLPLVTLGEKRSSGQTRFPPSLHRHAQPAPPRFGPLPLLPRHADDGRPRNDNSTSCKTLQLTVRLSKIPGKRRPNANVLLLVNSFFEITYKLIHFSSHNCPSRILHAYEHLTLRVSSLSLSSPSSAHIIFAYITHQL